MSVWIYLSGVGIVVTVFDKIAAKAGSWRVAESHLLVISAIGGWPGVLVGMLVSKHKTSKHLFLVKFAMASALNIAVSSLLNG